MLMHLSSRCRTLSGTDYLVMHATFPRTINYARRVVSLRSSLCTQISRPCFSRHVIKALLGLCASHVLSKDQKKNNVHRHRACVDDVHLQYLQHNVQNSWSRWCWCNICVGTVSVQDIMLQMHHWSVKL